MSNEAKKVATPRVSVTATMIKADLAEGLNRKEIAVKYGVPKAQVDKIFKDPRLAGNRPKGKASLILVDEEDYTPAEAPIPATSVTEDPSDSTSVNETEETDSQVTGI